MTCRIAICDDMPIILSELEKRFNNALSGFNLQTHICTYTSGEALILDAEKGVDFDLAVIDLSLPGIDGLETAKRLRSNNKSMLIVFCTGYDPYPDLFKVHPFSFLHKGFSKLKMHQEIIDILSELEESRKNGVFMSFDGKESLEILIRDIVYVEGTKRGSTLAVAEKKTGKISYIPIKESLEDIWNQFPELIRIHKSYLVNIMHIRSHKGNKILTQEGKVLSMSRSYKSEAIMAIFNRVSKIK